MLARPPRKTTRKVEILHGIEQAARVLEVVARYPMGIRLTDLARELKASKATVYRTAVSWLALGYLAQLDDGSYVVGARLFELASQYWGNLDLRQAAHPVLTKLNRASGETVHLSVLDDDAIVYVDKVEGRQPIQVYTTIGKRGPLHATASGKAAIAHLPDWIDGLRPDHPLPRFTNETITGIDALKAELLLIRSRGYAVNAGEWHSEVGGVGVPVFDHQGTVIGGLSITLPTMYLTGEKVETLADLLRSAGSELSARLGYVGGEPVAISTLGTVPSSPR
jgi:DNA-binding IclR family transcriptional regulator